VLAQGTGNGPSTHHRHDVTQLSRSSWSVATPSGTFSPQHVAVLSRRTQCDAGHWPAQM